MRARRYGSMATGCGTATNFSTGGLPSSFIGSGICTTDKSKMADINHDGTISSFERFIDGSENSSYDQTLEHGGDILALSGILAGSVWRKLENFFHSI